MDISGYLVHLGVGGHLALDFYMEFNLNEFYCIDYVETFSPETCLVYGHPLA